MVLPELATSGYVFESTDEARACAITPDHPVFAAWAGHLARGGSRLVVGGFAERGTDGNLYNSAAAVTADGVVAVYRKTHLWDREKLWFQAGDDRPPVIAIDGARVGVAICYDLEFPEVTRHLALRGADLVAVPTNWPLVPRPDGEHPPEVVIAMAAARVNRVAIACCDRTGTERGVEWTAGTSIVGVDGWVLATAGDDGRATADIDLSTARDKRLTEQRRPLRRPPRRRLRAVGGRPLTHDHAEVAEMRPFGLTDATSTRPPTDQASRRRPSRRTASARIRAMSLPGAMSR